MHLHLYRGLNFDWSLLSELFICLWPFKPWSPCAVLFGQLSPITKKRLPCMPKGFWKYADSGRLTGDSLLALETITSMSSLARKPPSVAPSGLVAMLVLFIL